MHRDDLQSAARVCAGAPRATCLAEPLESRVLASGNPSGWARFLDPTFGSAGTVSVDSRSAQITVQPDGKVVVTALAGDVNNYAFALARYNADGSPDLAFGRDGTGRIVT